MQKECAACGAYFDDNRTNVKYCPDCRATGCPAKIKEKVDRETERSIRQFGTGRKVQPRHIICKNCGKEFDTWDKYADEFCSDGCRAESAAKGRKCAKCGKPLYGMDFICARGLGFCSEGCRDVYIRDMDAKFYATMRERGFLHECPNCGKTFIREQKNAIFCSQGCYAHAIKCGWRKEASPRWEPCENCGKMVWTMPARHVFCSGECSRALRPVLEARKREIQEECAERARKHAERVEIGKDPERLREYKAAQAAAREQKKAREKALRREQAARKKEAALAKKSVREAAYIEKNGLCAVCRTPYCNCERMQSNFCIIPEGAKYGMNGKIRKCPKFAG